MTGTGGPDPGGGRAGRGDGSGGGRRDGSGGGRRGGRGSDQGGGCHADGEDRGTVTPLFLSGGPAYDPEICDECAAAFGGPELDCPHCGQPFGESDAAPADLGDIVIALLVGTLAGLRDRLYADGFEPAASVIQDLIEVADDYVARVAP